MAQVSSTMFTREYEAAGLLRGGLVLARDHRARHLGHGSLVPRPPERPPALERRPEAVRHHGDAVRHLDDVLHALHPRRGRRVEALDLAAEDRAALDRGDEHPRDLDVGAVNAATRDLLRRVAPLDGLADVPELVGALRGRVLGDGELLRSVHELPVEEPPPAGPVAHSTLLGLDALDGPPPLVCRRLGEHLAGGSRAFAPHRGVVADAPASAVGLGAGHGILVERGIGRRLLDADLVEDGIQFVGDDHGRRGERALPHLRHGVDDRHDAVTVDPEPLVRREHAGGLRQRDPAGATRDGESDGEPRADDEAASEERASGDERVHYAPPFLRAAARWIAARMRWYVPQRQMLPDIASSMSASVDRKSTRLNSSHGYISYAVFCLKKKKK